MVFERLARPMLAGMDQSPCLVDFEGAANVVWNLDQNVGRVGCKAVTRDRLLHRVKGLEHDAGYAEFGFFVFALACFEAEFLLYRAEKLVD